MVYRSPSMALRDLRSLTLAVHVASGAVALLASVIAASIAKGPGAHARIGRVYAVAMLLVAATAVVLWAFGASTFLLLVALFSAQLVATGWRLARHRAGTPGAIDRRGGGRGSACTSRGCSVRRSAPSPPCWW
jgi:uncharacterized membrane protein